jgi:hypothetical protein
LISAARITLPHFWVSSAMNNWEERFPRLRSTVIRSDGERLQDQVRDRIRV